MKLKNKILLIAICFLLINLMLFKLPLEIGKICAQEDRFLSSSACVTNYVVCPAGFKNFQAMIDNEDYIGHDITRDDMLKAFGKLNGEDLRSVCIPDSISHFIPIIETAYEENIHGGSLGSTGPGLITRGIVFLALGFAGNAALPEDGELIVRACPPNWVGQKMVNVSAFGCCPQGFTYVGEYDNFLNNGGVGLNGSACCRNATPTEGVPIKIDKFRGDCFTNSPVNPDLAIAYTPVSSTTFEGLSDEIENGTVVNFSGFESSIGESTQFVILGLNMGDYYVTAGSTIGGLERMKAVPNTGAPKVCPNEIAKTGCAINGLGETVAGEYFNSIGGTSKTDPRVTCRYCYGNDEPIRVRTEANDEERLELCIGVRSPLPRGAEQATASSAWVDLINGNIYDTIAYYKADESNRDTLLTCRERGGIYVAIGCVDPTPVGILTGLIRLAFGVVGGVALVQLILAGVAYQSGNEERIQESKKKIFATLGGLAVLVFSVLILRIIGVNVLDVLPIGAI